MLFLLCREFSFIFPMLFDGVNDCQVSLPNGGDSTISSMNKLFCIMKPRLQSFNLWQLDGHPMSGDIWRGATKESIAFAVQLAKAKERPPIVCEYLCLPKWSCGKLLKMPYPFFH
ncbi:hypothetical protein GLYMA_18G184250v4 [Glycine max]|nr:hypothetical protein GLYMA_18G184250v4 [Glycine max]KAH1155062.1 hypothetical protein GYH30_050384 [Glycine max]